MVPLTEFYLGAMWSYRGKTVKRILDELTEFKSVTLRLSTFQTCANHQLKEGTEITYDREYEWFKIICPANEADGIRQGFKDICSRIEVDAFTPEAGTILDEYGIIQKYFDNEWIQCENQSLSEENVDEVCGEYYLPDAFSRFSHTAVWDDLDKNNENFALQDIVSGQQLDQINRDTGVALSCNLSGRLVYIGGNDEESVCAAQDKLTVMLINKKISAIRHASQHLLYAEDYVDRDHAEFAADIRYLANIDPKLVSSTLFDQAVERNWEEAYQGIYREGASIRLCYWDPDKMYHASLLGPKVVPRSIARHILGSRPPILGKTVERLDATPGDITIPGQDRSEFRSQVATWIKALPDDAESVSSTSGDEGNIAKAKAAKDEIAQETPPISPSAESTDGSLNLLDEPAEEAAALEAYSPLMVADNTGGASLRATGLELGETRQIESLSCEFSKTQLATPVTPGDGTIPNTQSNTKRRSLLSFTGPDCLIDMLDAVETPGSSNTLVSSIHWGMPPLIPPSWDGEVSRNGESDAQGRLPATKNQSTGNQSSSSGIPAPAQVDPKKDASRFKGFLKSGAPDFQPTGKSEAAQEIRTLKVSSPVGASTQPTQLPKPKSKNFVLAQPTQPPKPRQPMSPDQLPATRNFVREIEEAMCKLLCTGPFRRGKVAVRAEFGRAIFEGVDPTGLAFNGANTRSFGWDKSDLLTKLNANYPRRKNFHFTKVLSTYGPDVEDMINIKARDNRIWEPQPSRAWTTYSFHCVIRRGSSSSNKTTATENPVGFIVDVEDNDSLADPFSYSIRPPYHGRFSERLMPVYIHAVRRHWDLRIVMSHVETTEWERVFGLFARTLVQSLSISNSEKRAPEVKFAVHKSFPVEVTDVRVLTKWCHPSINGRSELEITEAEQLEITPCSDSVYSTAGEDWKASSARPWTPRETKQRRAKGNSPRWYKAAVVSPDAEALFQQNSVLALGEKAGWNDDDIKKSGILVDIYGPALQMLRGMDHVGRNDDNQLSEVYGPLLLRVNDPPYVLPGAAVVRGQGAEIW